MNCAPSQCKTLKTCCNVTDETPIQPISKAHKKIFSHLVLTYWPLRAHSLLAMFQKDKPRYLILKYLQTFHQSSHY